MTLQVGADELDVEQLFLLYSSLKQNISLDELFWVPEELRNEISYSLKAISCFTGAHYYLAIKERTENGKFEWWVINDDQDPRYFGSLSNLLAEQVQIQAKPAHLIYEKNDRFNLDPDANNPIDIPQLERAYKLIVDTESNLSQM